MVMMTMMISLNDARYPNMMDLSGTVYSVLETATPGVDPYSLVEARHLPQVKMYDVAVMMIMIILISQEKITFHLTSEQN